MAGWWGDQRINRRMHRSRHLLPLIQEEGIWKHTATHRSWIPNYFRILIHIFLVAEVGIENSFFFALECYIKVKKKEKERWNKDFEKESSEREEIGEKRRNAMNPCCWVVILQQQHKRRWMVSHRCSDVRNTCCLIVVSSFSPFHHFSSLFSHTFHFPDFFASLSGYSQISLNFWRFVFLFSEEERASWWLNSLQLDNMNIFLSRIIISALECSRSQFSFCFRRGREWERSEFNTIDTFHTSSSLFYLGFFFFVWWWCR